MDHIHGAYNNGVRNVLAPLPKFMKDVQIGMNGNTVIGLGKDKNLHVKMQTDATLFATDSIEGPFEQFAIRPNMYELATIKRGASAVVRHLLHCPVVPCELPIEHPTAVAYNKNGNMIAAANEYGKVIVWTLGEEGPPRAFGKCRISDEKIVRMYFENSYLIALTARGRCFRIPFNFYNTPQSLLDLYPEPYLVAGDKEEFEWNCYSYASRPQIFLEVFGGECGILIARHNAFDTLQVKKTGLGTYIQCLGSN